MKRVSVPDSEPGARLAIVKMEDSTEVGSQLPPCWTQFRFPFQTKRQTGLSDTAIQSDEPTESDSVDDRVQLPSDGQCSSISCPYVCGSFHIACGIV